MISSYQLNSRLGVAEEELKDLYAQGSHEKLQVNPSQLQSPAGLHFLFLFLFQKYTLMNSLAE